VKDEAIESKITIEVCSFQLCNSGEDHRLKYVSYSQYFPEKFIYGRNRERSYQKQNKTHHSDSEKF